MELHSWPTTEAWFRLNKIASNIDLIVDDEPRPPKSRASGGLLGDYLPAVADEPDEEPISRLAAGSQVFLDPNLAEELEQYLPGIRSLGSSRSQRLDTLRARLRTLPAYAWLTSQAGFAGAMETARFLAARKQEGYQSDVNDFKLIDALCFPFLMFQLSATRGLTPTYPTRPDLEEAAVKANDLAKFLKLSGGLVRSGKIKYQLEGMANQIAVDLTALVKTKYKKPAEGIAINEIQFSYDVVDGLVRAFGVCSPAILGAVLAVVEYTPDESRIRDLIKSRRAGG